MKPILVLCLALAIAFIPANGLLVSSVTGKVSTILNTFHNRVNSVKMESTESSVSAITAQVLWNDLFEPLLDQFLTSASEFLNTHFGTTLNAVQEDENTELETMFVEFVTEVMTTGSGMIIPIIASQATVNDLLRMVIIKFITYVQTVVQYSLPNLSSMFNDVFPEALEAASTLQSQMQGVTELFQNELNPIGSFFTSAASFFLGMFYYPFADLINFYQNQLENIAEDIKNTIGSSIVGLILSTTTTENIMSDALYVMVNYAYDALYVTEDVFLNIFAGLLEQYETYIQLGHSFAQEFGFGNVDFSEFESFIQHIGQQLIAANGILLLQSINSNLLG